MFKLEKLKFKARIITIGNSRGVIIPKAYLDQGMLDEGKEYQFYVTETEE